MCRWLAYSGTPILLEEVLVKRDRSLIDQSLHSRLGATTTNGDGFGVGWYDTGGTPRLYRSTHPAWNDRNLRRARRRRLRRRCSSRTSARRPGRRSRRPTRIPFRYGRWLWMHNGLIREFSRGSNASSCSPWTTRLYPSIEGTTDSETFFYLALTLGLES